MSEPTSIQQETRSETTQYGFIFGAAEVQRTMSHKGYVVIRVITPRQTLAIKVTPTGLIKSWKEERQS